jgi:hypothetical protein
MGNKMRGYSPNYTPRTIAQDLANALVTADSSSLGIVFKEADASRQLEVDAEHFLKVDGKRLGHDFEAYAWDIYTDGSPFYVTLRLLFELVLPLKEISPKAFEAGMAFLREQESLLGNPPGWQDVIDKYMQSTPA